MSDPHVENITFGFLSSVKSIHFPSHKPGIVVGITCGGNQPTKPIIQGGVGTVDLVSLVTFNDGAPGVSAIYIVNLTKFTAGKTSIISTPGIGPPQQSNWTSYSTPFDDILINPNILPYSAYTQLRYFIGDNSTQPQLSKDWAGSVTVNYYRNSLSQDLIIGDMAFQAWPLTQAGNLALPDAATNRIIEQWDQIRQASALDGNPNFNIPPPPSWTATPSGNTSVPTSITFQIFNGRLLKGPIPDPVFSGQFKSYWPAAKPTKPAQGKDLPQTSKTNPNKSYRDVVLTHANPITDKSNIEERKDPDGPFGPQIERIAASGEDSLTIPEDWNLRDGQSKPFDQTGQLFEGATFDGWYDEAVINGQFPPPDPPDAWELDSPNHF